MSPQKQQGAALERCYDQRLETAESKGRNFYPAECVVSAGNCRGDSVRPDYTGFYRALFAHRGSSDDPVREALFDAISDSTLLEDREIDELMVELQQKGITTAEQYFDAALENSGYVSSAYGTPES